MNINASDDTKQEIISVKIVIDTLLFIKQIEVIISQCHRIYIMYN